MSGIEIGIWYWVFQWDWNTRPLFILRTFSLDWVFEELDTIAGLSLQRTLFTLGPSELCPLERRAGQGIAAKISLGMSCPQACPWRKEIHRCSQLMKSQSCMGYWDHKLLSLCVTIHFASYFILLSCITFSCMYILTYKDWPYYVAHHVEKAKRGHMRRHFHCSEPWWIQFGSTV